MSAAELGLVAAVFVACAVEAVEAVTIVLAMGLTRGWRSALRGVAAGLAVLVVVVAALGPALTALPLSTLRLVVGALLLVFGLQWLRKAILRAAGRKALHDEEAIFAAEEAFASELPAARPGRTDAYGFTIAFKGVLLEGLEVAFIVLTFGSNAGRIGLAAATAAVAVAVVVGVALLARAPLARVPENTMKFAVGVLLTTFGIFWGAEGAGIDWPGGELALLGVLLLMSATGLAFAALLRREGEPGRPAVT